MIGQPSFRIYLRHIGNLVLDKETIAIRNKRMAEAFHQPALTHRVRDGLLKVVGKAPIFLQNTNVKRLLIIRPDHLGDVLLSTPAIRAIKHKRPDISIHVLCGEWSAGALANYDEIDVVLTLPFPGFDRSAPSNIPNPYRQAIASSRMLRKIGYSSAIIMRPDHWWGAILAFFAGIRERIGYDIGNVSPFLTTALPHEHQHVVKQNLRLVENWTGEQQYDQIRYSFPVNQDDKDYIDSYLADWRILPDKPIICIHAGSGTNIKMWEARKWAKVADMLTSQFSASIIFTGSASEVFMINNIKQYMTEKAYIMAGSTNLEQLAALYARSLAVLGSDSGPMHLAAAVNTPTVTLFGPADPIEFAPWGHRRNHAILTSNIGCQPCRILDWHDDKLEYHPCVKDITIGQVLEESRRVILAEG
jgi:lipopolysaccharide heptosyltransferase II